jgi:hypothetical protein
LCLLSAIFYQRHFPAAFGRNSDLNPVKKQQMKKIRLFLLFVIPACSGLMAQKCLDINIVSLMGKLGTPGNAETSFKNCNTGKNDHHQTVINNYGTDLVQLDTMETQMITNFSFAATPGLGSASANDSRAMAEKLKSMTPDQQKEWIQQNYIQNHSAGAAPVQDDGPTSQQVLQVRTIASMQMKNLNDEFSAKLSEIDNKCKDEIKTVALGDKSKCPSDIVGMPSCACTNKIESTRWTKVLAIQDKYDAQKIDVYQTYLPKIKALAAQVDNAVTKYNYGANLKSSQMKQMLFSAQSSAFSNAFLITTICVEGIRKDGSNVFVNKVNSDNGVYDISCSSK